MRAASTLPDFLFPLPANDLSFAFSVRRPFAFSCNLHSTTDRCGSMTSISRMTSSLLVGLFMCVRHSLLFMCVHHSLLLGVCHSLRPLSSKLKKYVRGLDILKLQLFVLHNTDTISFPLSALAFSVIINNKINVVHNK